MVSLVSHYKAKAERRVDQRRQEAIQSAQDQLQPAPTYYAGSESSEEEYDAIHATREQNLRNSAYQEFRKLLRYFPDPPTSLPEPLPKPVFIPQPRLGDRLRGFQLFYAEDLARSGVTEQQFVSFLNRLNIAMGFDNKLKLFNFAVDIATLAVPSWELLVAAIATQAVTTTAAHTKSRAKSEAYVATANERYSHPRGLHAQLVPICSVTPPSPTASYTTPTVPDPDRGAGCSQSSFQFSVGSPHVLPRNHPKARGGFLNLNKRPIDYDPFDYGPGYVRIRPDQYSPLRPSHFKEPSTKMLEKVMDQVDRYNVWQDRIPAKKAARRARERKERLETIRNQHGEAGLQRYLAKEEMEYQKSIKAQKTKLKRFLDRNKIILIITNLNPEAREQVKSSLTTRYTAH